GTSECCAEAPTRPPRGDVPRLPGARLPPAASGPGVAVVRSLRHPCARGTEWPGRADHRRLARVRPRDRSLRRFLEVPELQIASRWHGTYARHPQEPHLVLDPLPGLRVVTGVGGAGMTLSFGLAARVIEEVLGPV